MLSPLRDSLFIHNCVAMHANSIIMFADNTTVMGLITNNDETAYRKEEKALGVWCQEKKKNFKKQQREHPPIHIEGTAVEKVESFKFLSVHITDKLKWSTTGG